MEHHYRVQLHDSNSGRIIHRDVFAAHASLLADAVKEQYPGTRILGWYEIQ